MCYAPFQIWLPQLLRYGGVASHVAVRARTQLLKELDPGSNPAERGWSRLWCLRAGHAGEPFSLQRFAQERSTAAAGGAGDQGLGAAARDLAGGRGWWSEWLCRCETTIIGMSSVRAALLPEIQLF